MKAGHKACVRCAEEIKLEAKVCRHCGHEFSPEEMVLGEDQAGKAALGRLFAGIGTVAVLAWIAGKIFVEPHIPPNNSTVTVLPAYNSSPITSFTAESATTPKIKSDTKKHCAARYPANYTMRGACTRNAYEGAQDFIKIWNRYRTDDGMSASLAGCYDRYAENGAHNWMMIGACARNNEEGYRDVH